MLCIPSPESAFCLPSVLPLLTLSLTRNSFPVRPLLQWNQYPFFKIYVKFLFLSFGHLGPKLSSSLWISTVVSTTQSDEACTTWGCSLLVAACLFVSLEAECIYLHPPGRTQTLRSSHLGTVWTVSIHLFHDSSQSSQLSFFWSFQEPYNRKMGQVFEYPLYKWGTEAKRDEVFGSDYSATVSFWYASKFTVLQTTLHLPPLSIPILLHLSSLFLSTSENFQDEIAFRKYILVRFFLGIGYFLNTTGYFQMPPC